MTSIMIISFKGFARESTHSEYDEDSTRVAETRDNRDCSTRDAGRGYHFRPQSPINDGCRLSCITVDGRTAFYYHRPKVK